MLENNMIDQIRKGQVNDNIPTIGVSALVSIIENENFLYLLYADLITRTIFLINPIALEMKKQDKFQEEFVVKWNDFSEKNLLINDKWKKGGFKFNSKNKIISERDIPILFCFETLQNNQKHCKVDVHSFKMKRKIVLITIADHGIDLQLFCSCCGDNFLQNNNAFRCMCRRKFHVDCMDVRYSTYKLYKYNSFHCYFCRRGSEKNIFRIRLLA